MSICSELKPELTQCLLFMIDDAVERCIRLDYDTAIPSLSHNNFAGLIDRSAQRGDSMTVFLRTMTIRRALAHPGIIRSMKNGIFPAAAVCLLPFIVIGMHADLVHNLFHVLVILAMTMYSYP